jgi:glycosyltransferase involved in cell wall biosynthesis
MIALLGRNEMPLVVTRRVPFPPRSVRVKYGSRVTRFIAISNAVKDAMVEGGVDAARISIVHSGIAHRSSKVEPRDWRAELGWETGSVIVGIVGAMTAEKGLDFLQAIGNAMPASARKKARVILLGGTAGAIHEAGGLTVHSAGFVSDIDPAVQGLDVLWHPSRAEGLGTSVIDAMSLGVPPVAFATGGLPEVIEDDVSGILVPPGDPAAFATAAARMIEDSELRARLGAGAIQKAKTFDAVEMTKGTEAVYDEVLSG